MLYYDKGDLVPKSDATNSYDLLVDVTSAIKEEPNRFNWTDWYNYGRLPESPVRLAQGACVPDCHTIGCVSGWCGILTRVGGQTIFAYSRQDLFPPDTRDDVVSLFYANWPYGGDNDGGFTNSLEPQLGETQEQYANRAITAIQLFMSKFEPDLRAYRLPV